MYCRSSSSRAAARSHSGKANSGGNCLPFPVTQAILSPVLLLADSAKAGSTQREEAEHFAKGRVRKAPLIGRRLSICRTGAKVSSEYETAPAGDVSGNRREPPERRLQPGLAAPLRHSNQRGSVAIWLAVILVPVILGLLGFALDLGMLYSAKGELKTAANAMALATAQNLIGTDAAQTQAQAAGLLTVQNSAVPGNKYNFQGLPIGVTTGTLVSTIADPAYYADAADAIASGTSTGGATSQASSADSKYVRISISGETPLVFWGLLPIVNSRKLAVQATAVAGVSAPLCLACGIEPFAVAAVDQTDTTDFGFIDDTIYSFTYSCIVSPAGAPGVPPAPAPPLLGGASVELFYVLLNRLDPNNTVFPDETSQAYQDAAGGLPSNTNTAQACFMVNNTESIWVDATVNRCGVTVTPVVTAALCGLDARFESTQPSSCSTVVNIDTLDTIYPPDNDFNTYNAYTDYAGNGRRIITIPIVDSIASTTSMTVLGYREFLLLPNSGDTDLVAGDTAGRFLCMYIGSVAPISAGRFDGCTQTAGPGKVVLHQ
jgi:Flp pilus assembly protein TadG